MEGNQDIKKNIYLGIIVLSLAFIFSSTYVLQIIHGNKYAQEAIGMTLADSKKYAPRSLILDRNGNILAESVEAYNVYLKYSENIEADIEEVSVRLGTKLEAGVFKKFKFEVLDLSKKEDQMLANSLSGNEIKSVSELIADEENLYVTSEFRREYLYPKQFSHIIGYTGIANAEDLEAGYELNEVLGKYRLEQQYDEEIRGTDGKLVSQNGTQILYPPESGANVYLNIELDWQLQLYRLLQDYNSINGAAGGAAVIVKSSTGEVMAQTTYPGFDTNEFISGISDTSYSNLINGRGKPLLDKSMSIASVPGSIFKLISAYTLLEEGVINYDTIYHSNSCIYLGQSQFCEFGKLYYGYMNIIRAIYKSSNLFFCNYLQELEHIDNLASFEKAADLFNIGNKTGIDLDGEIAGKMDSPTVRFEESNKKWFPGDTCNAAIGQGAILVTPLQMAMVVNTLINKGEILTPHIVHHLQDQSGHTTYESGREVKDIIPLSESTVNIIFEGMSEVAYNPGSAVSYYLSKFSNNIRAKTGSAETFENINGTFVERTHSWIIGAFDFEGETYTFAFFQQYGGGGYYITPMLRDFMNYINDS